MAWNTSWKRKLFEQPLHALFILLNGGIDVGVSPFEIGVRHHARPAMPWTADVNDVEVVHFDDAIQVHVNEVQTWSRTPVSQQTTLDMLDFHGFTQQRTGFEGNHSVREIL